MQISNDQDGEADVPILEQASEVEPQQASAEGKGKRQMADETVPTTAMGPSDSDSMKTPAEPPKKPISRIEQGQRKQQPVPAPRAGDKRKRDEEPVAQGNKRRGEIQEPPTTSGVGPIKKPQPSSMSLRSTTSKLKEVHGESSSTAPPTKIPRGRSFSYMTREEIEESKSMPLEERGQFHLQRYMNFLRNPEDF